VIHQNRGVDLKLKEILISVLDKLSTSERFISGEDARLMSGSLESLLNINITFRT
jgi:hypothetical protein